LLRGTEGTEWQKVVEIVASWVISPLLSGLVSCLLYILVDLTVLRRKDPLTAGFRALPFIYFGCIAFNVFAVTYQGSKGNKLYLISGKTFSSSPIKRSSLGRIFVEFCYWSLERFDFSLHRPATFIEMD
jgi:phosphate/sulfate permease